MTAETAEWPSWFQEAEIASAAPRSVEVEGALVAYDLWPARAESGLPPLLFVHGGSAASCWWHPMVALLGASRSIAAIDLSGHGRSQWRDGYSFDTWVREVIAVAEHAFPSGCALVGHSLGGAVAGAAVAAGYPAKALVTLDSDAQQPSTQQPPALEEVKPPRVFGDAASAARAVVARKGSWPRWLADYVGPLSIEPVAAAWRMRRDPRVAAVRVNGTLLHTLSPVPVHVVIGEDSVFRFHERIPAIWGEPACRVGVSVLPGLGHDLLMESPERVAELLRGILPG